jgi:hypothetical protein
MAQYAPIRAPPAVAVGTDPARNTRPTPLTWPFTGDRNHNFRMNADGPDH